MIPLQFKLSEELVVKAAVLNASRFQMFYVVLAVAVSIATAAFTLTGTAPWTWERMVLQIGLTLAGALAITGVVIALMRFVAFPFQARRNFRQQKALSDDMALSWTDEKFLLETGKSRTEMPFADLHGFKASNEIVLLYLTNALYLLLPVAAFADPEQLGAFMQKVRAARLRHR